MDSADVNKVASNRAPAKIGGIGNRGEPGKVDELSSQIMELKITVDGLEKERDFYFGKLRDIEVMCQECDNSESPPIIQKILEVLYATEDNGNIDECGDQTMALHLQKKLKEKITKTINTNWIDYYGSNKKQSGAIESSLFNVKVDT
ncbi:hypothetical protein TSAR_008574 [Trichomalopsis sarcophagae]|uniref:EB1 C-terminal domain-containing protein n=1 Tax=Trichomalopsis sarcophagae TaxID=543379 RepID=A0A232FCG1_9HYME|nr:hypothetical protein TSAR_008574 [Trichomalopsis sarcophagae]